MASERVSGDVMARWTRLSGTVILSCQLAGLSSKTQSNVADVRTDGSST